MTFRPALLALAVCRAVAAQENTSQETVVLDPIVVRVRGIDESAVAVPLSVQHMDEDTIARRRLATTEDSLRHNAGVEITSGGDPNNSFLWVRGTGSLANASLDDNSVGIHFDGASQGISGISRNLFDMRSIEIGKGPQGTLYGHNAEVGIIKLESHDPEDTFSADIDAGIGTNHLRELKTAVNLPLGDTLSARVAAMGQWRDHYVQNSETGKPLLKQDNTGIRGKLLWQPLENTSAMLTLYHDRRDNSPPLMLFTPEEHPPRFTAGPMDYSARRESKGVHLDISHTFPAFRFDANSRFTRQSGYTPLAANALDNLPNLYRMMQVPPAMQDAINAFYRAPGNNMNRQQDDIRQFEQELRLTALPEAPVQWVAGAYFQERTRHFHYDGRRNLLPLPAPLPPLNADAFNADMKRRFRHSEQAVYGEITYPATDSLKLIGGLRLTRQTLRYQADWQPNPANPLGAIGAQHDAQTLKDTHLSGRIGLDYALSPDWHLYGMYSRGHKSAGFSDYSTNMAYGGRDTPYTAGRIDAFEIGSKGEHGPFRWHAALFHNRVKNDKIHVALYPSFLTQSFNVDTQSRGIELGGSYRPDDHWTIDARANWTDAKVTRIPEITQSITKTGNRIPQVPRLAANLGIEYRAPLALSFMDNAELFARTDISHTGKRKSQPDNRLTLPSHTLVDATIGIENGKGSLYLWGKNLTDRRYMRYAYLPETFTTYTGYPGEGRTFGLGFRYRFE